MTPPQKQKHKRSVKSTNKDEEKVDTEASSSSSSSTSAGSDAKASTVTSKTDAIDDLLGGLSSDLEKIGVRTTAKGHCALCNKSVVGKVNKVTSTNCHALIVM